MLLVLLLDASFARVGFVVVVFVGAFISWTGGEGFLWVAAPSDMEREGDCLSARAEQYFEAESALPGHNNSSILFLSSSVGTRISG